METLIKSFDSVVTYLESLNDSELVTIHNTYCSDNNDSDDEIYCNDEDFFNTYFGSDVMGAIRAVSYGDFNYSHDYVKFDGYGNLETTNDPSEWIDKSEIANYILENPDTFDIEFIDLKRKLRVRIMRSKRNKK